MELYKNTQTLKGFLGKDAESFATRNQKTIVVLSLATKSGYKNQQTGKWVNHTEWHRIVVFRPSDEVKALRKGEYVEVEGETRTNEYPKEIVQGKNKVKVTFRDKEVHANTVKKLAAPAKGENLDAEPITEDDAA